MVRLSARSRSSCRRRARFSFRRWAKPSLPYEGELHATGVLRTRWSPPAEAKFLAGLFGQSGGPGLHQVKGTLRFQACNDSVCEPPTAIEFELPLLIE